MQLRCSIELVSNCILGPQTLLWNPVRAAYIGNRKLIKCNPGAVFQRWDVDQGTGHSARNVN